jgi:hypothetical protein
MILNKLLIHLNVLIHQALSVPCRVFRAHMKSGKCWGLERRGLGRMMSLPV